MKTQNYLHVLFRQSAQNGLRMLMSAVFRALGALTVAKMLLGAGLAHAAPAAPETGFPEIPASGTPSQIPVRFHVGALQESPLMVFKATLIDGMPIVDNVFTSLRRIDDVGPFASIEGQRSFAVRLNGRDGLRDAFVVLTATDRRCAGIYNTAAAQNTAGGGSDREYEIASLVISNLPVKRNPAGYDPAAISDVPVRSFPRTFCASENARFDVTFNALGPKGIPVVVSTLSATDDENIRNRFVWFLVI